MIRRAMSWSAAQRDVCRLILPLALLASGCSRIEVKRDSPEASAATIIKIYGEKKYELLEQVADPMAVRREKRQTNCLGVIFEDSQWWTAMAAGRAPDKPAPNVQACTCGPDGDRAAATAGAFATSDTHSALETAALDAKRCSIADAKELVGNARGDAMSSWERYACNDVPKDAKFSLVTVKCGNDAPVGMVMHQTTDGWRIYQLDLRSESALLLGSAANKAAAEEKKKRSDLNKDLK